MIVLKRDGSNQKFCSQKIFDAIMQASSSTEKELSTEEVHVLVQKIVDKLKGDTLSIEDIQKCTENVLMASKHKDIARKYIQYRHDRDVSRESRSKLYSDVKGFISQTSDEFTRENANKDAKTVNTHRDLLAGILSKNICSTQIVPKHLMQLHNEGYIHIHDMDYMISPLLNCCLVNYPDMLKNGFCIGNAKISSPKSIGVACTVLTQIVLAVSSAQYGGQSLAHIDSGLAPYVKKSHEKLLEKQRLYNLSDEFVRTELYKEVHDAMQTFLYQVNTMTSCNGQTPFITISLGLDTTEYGRMITEVYLQNHKRGLGEDGTTPVFPKVLFFLEEGVNMNAEDANYDLRVLAMETAVKRIYPDFVSVPLNRKITGSTAEPVTSMGCRSFLGKWIDPTTGKERYNGRANLGVVTVNLPLLALESDSEGTFYTKLGEAMDLAKEAHMLRIERLKGTKAKQNPVMYMHGALARLQPDDDISQLFYDGQFSISIGFVGLAETMEQLYGTLNKEKGLKILQFMKDRCEQYYKDTRLAFSIYGTPAESLCWRFAKCIEAKYPGTLQHEYLTNSFHQPVWVDSTPFEKWDYEEGFAELSSGGNIGYVETTLGNGNHNIKAYDTLLQYGYKHIPYFGINLAVDKCMECKFTGEFHADKDGFVCPDCGNRNPESIEVIRRISGYLGSASRPANHGKHHEMMERTKHQK